MFDDRQTVGDKKIGEPKLLLQILKQIDHLRLHRNVERRNRLVRNDQLWIKRQRASNTDALPLSAGKLMR